MDTTLNDYKLAAPTALMKKWHWVLTALFLGADAALCYSWTFSIFARHSIWKALFMVLYLWGLFSLLAYYLLYRVTYPRFREGGYSIRQFYGLLAGLAGCGVFLAVVIPVHVPQQPARQHLEIIATGNRNEQAQGREVRLVGLYGSDGTAIGFGQFRSDSASWAEQDNQLIAKDHFPANLLWEADLNEPIRLMFIAHPWSGIVRVVWNGQTHEIDLYSQQPTTKEVVFKPSITRPAFEIYYYPVVGILIAVILLVLLTFFVFSPVFQRLQVPPEEKPGANRRFIIFFMLVPLSVWVVFALTYWPGLMGSDFFDQWRQLISGQINDAHPAFHTLLMWLITRIYLSPGLVVIAQSLALALLVAVIFNHLRQKGIRLWVLWVFLILVAFWPAIAMMNLSVVKDVPYAIAFLWFYWLIVKIVESNGEILRSRQAIILLAIAGALVSLFRHNGLPFVVITLVGFTIMYWRYFKSFFAVFVLTILTINLVRGPLYSAFHIPRLETVEKYGLSSFLLPYIAAHLDADTPLAPDEEAFLNRIADIEDDWRYDPFTTVPVAFNPSIHQNRRFVIEYSNRVVDVFVKLTLRNPRVTINHWLNMTNMIWRVYPLPNSPFYTVLLRFDGEGRVITYDVDPYHTGLTLDSKLPFLLNPLTGWYLGWMDRYIVYFWRPALYLYLFIFFVCVRALRCKNGRWLLLALPAVLHSAMWLLLIPSPDFRYTYPVYLVAIVLLPYCLFGSTAPQRLTELIAHRI